MPQVALHIGPSVEAAWQNIVLPWFESSPAVSTLNGRPVVVVTPFRSHAYFLRTRLLAHGISLLGVRFFPPPQLREALLRGSGANVPLREHLRLLLAIAAERFAAESDGAKIDIANSVSRDPDHFLRALDQLGAAGWSFDEIGPDALRGIARQFEKIVRACGFQFVHEADRAATRTAGNSEPLFAHLLVIGFNGAHWPLWPLLRAAVLSSKNAAVVLSDPRDEARDLDEAWVGTWEENFGAARVIDAVTERSASPEIHFLAGRDTAGQAKAIVALTAKFLCQGNCERIGILFPRGGALPRLVAAFLDATKIAHFDGVAHFAPGVFDNDALRSWLDLQETPRLRTLIRFLRAAPPKTSGQLPILKIEKALRDAYADMLIDDIDVLREYLARKNAHVDIVRVLKAVELLPATATLLQFLAQTRKIFAGIGWIQHWSEIERLGRRWTGCVAGSLSRRNYLRWLREILGAASLARDEHGAHPYSRVHLLPYAEAEGQAWSHLIFAGLNEETWPTMADEPGFIGDQEVGALNQKVLNRCAVKRGRHGQGQWSVRENKTLLLGSTERRQIMLRRFLNLIEPATAGMGVTANVYSDAFPRRISNPSELFSRLYFTMRRRSVSQETMQALERQTRDWLKNWSPIDAQKVDSISIGRTRLSFDARRKPRASGEYEFALRAAPDREIALSVTEWEQALRWPELVWMKTFLGVEAEEENADAWAISTGQWVHRWLAHAARISNSDHLATGQVRVPATNGFVDLIDAEKIRARILEDARRFRDEVQNLCAACVRPLPDWWISGWNNALYIADCLAERLSGLSDWQELATEWALGSPATISLSPNEMLRLRGRIDLILARGERDGSKIGYPELWVVDYKTGRQRGFNLRELRKGQTPQEKLRKQLVDGRGVQLALYALAVHALGAARVQMTLLSPGSELEPQFSLEHVLAQKEFWRELVRMQETGVFGMRGEIFNEYGIARKYPLAILAIDPDFLCEKWEMTHPAFAVEHTYAND